MLKLLMIPKKKKTRKTDSRINCCDSAEIKILTISTKSRKCVTMFQFSSVYFTANKNKKNNDQTNTNIKKNVQTRKKTNPILYFLSKLLLLPSNISITII